MKVRIIRSKDLDIRCWSADKYLNDCVGCRRLFLPSSAVPCAIASKKGKLIVLTNEKTRLFKSITEIDEKIKELII